MPSARPALGLAVCCFLLGGAAVNVLVHWRSPPRRENFPPGTFVGQAIPSWPETVARYGLWEMPAETVVTDAGHSLHVFAARRPKANAAPLSDSAAVWQQLRTADLVRLGPPGGECNCHGWVFLGGRAWMVGEEVEAILRENGYRPVDPPLPGDLVVYRDGGLIQHSGVVVGVAEGGQALVESVWGDQGHYAHRAELPGYGRYQFYRSARPGHHLHGWEAVSAETDDPTVKSR